MRSNQSGPMLLAGLLKALHERDIICYLKVSPAKMDRCNAYLYLDQLEGHARGDSPEESVLLAYVRLLESIQAPVETSVQNL